MRYVVANIYATKITSENSKFPCNVHIYYTNLSVLGIGLQVILTINIKTQQKENQGKSCTHVNQMHYKSIFFV